MKPWKLSLIPIAMFGFGFALVPLYDVFCDITGLNGKLDLSVRHFDTNEISNRVVKFQFIADATARDTYNFHPEKSSLRVNLGQSYKTHFSVNNPSNKTLVVQAVPSVSPGASAQYLAKMECFCFNRQSILPGETVNMPLVFQVSQNLPTDINQMTLAYTLYVIDDSFES